MEDLADLAESEMSSMGDPNDMSSVHSFGSAGSNNQRRLQGFRNKHAKCLMALKKKADGGVPSDLSLKMAPADRLRLATTKKMLQAQVVSALDSGGGVGPQPGRQDTFDSEDLSDFDRARTTSAEAAFTQAADVAEDADDRVRLGSQVRAWEDAATNLNGIREALSMQQGGIDALRPQDAKPQVVELRSVVTTQGQELEQLRLQEVHSVVRNLKDSVETFDKLGSQRLEERQAAIDRLKEAIIAQSKDFEGLKLMGSDFKAVQQSITNQAHKLSKLQPAVRELRDELLRARAAVSARGNALESLTRQLQDQRQEHLNEVQRLRVALRVQDERSTALRAEIAAIRQKSEVAAALKVEDSSFGAGLDSTASGSNSMDLPEKPDRIRQRRTIGGMRPEVVQLAAAGCVGAILPLLVSLAFPRSESMTFSTGTSRSLPPPWHTLARNAMQVSTGLPALAPVSSVASHTPAFLTERKLRLRRRTR